MSDIFISPNSLTGKITVPYSKSIAHRAILCAALAGNIKLSGVCKDYLSDDITTTCDAVTALLNNKNEIFCKESGSTLRFMMPIAAALGKKITFTGSESLAKRPIDEYKDIFDGKGVRLDLPEEGSLPLHIEGKLIAGHYAVSGDISSQYITGLLLALPILNGDSKIVLKTALQSAAYVDLTIRVMQHFGIKVEKQINGYYVYGNQKYLKTPYVVEGDYSQAAFWITANFLGSHIELLGLEPSSAQADRKIIEILANFSRDITGKKKEKPIFEIDASQIPDIVPIICVAAANINAVTKIVNAKRLRYKESDRIASTCDMIRHIGGNIIETEEGMILYGTSEKMKGGTVDSYNDHRIAMAASIAALNTLEGVTLKNYRCINKSYPNFFRDFNLMGGITNELGRGK